MKEEKIFRFSEDFYQKLGSLKKEIKKMPRPDRARILLASAFIKGDDVLDIGTYWGDFLKIAKKRQKDIYGTEINAVRCNEANKELGGNAVRVDFLHGHLNTFETESVDVVSCMEVLEHTDDITTAASELLRVARKRIILSVPYKQDVRYHLCIYCNRPTPESNHLHKFDEKRIKSLFKGAEKIRTFKFGHKLIYWIPLPLFVLIRIDRFLSCFLKPRWMFAIIDK
jgi:ubiquinone/menaquinone biosynthesis C-methylase UbiE